MDVLKQIENIKIVIVDDDELIVNLLSKTLSKVFPNLTSFSSSTKCLKFLQEKKSADLLITDITMPELTGINLAKTIQKNIPNLKILFITGHSYDEVKSKLQEVKNFKYITKPVLRKPLYKKIKEFYHLNE